MKVTNQKARSERIAKVKSQQSITVSVIASRHYFAAFFYGNRVALKFLCRKDDWIGFASAAVAGFISDVTEFTVDCTDGRYEESKLSHLG